MPITIPKHAKPEKSSPKTPKPLRVGQWLDEVQDSVGRLITMETTEGAKRSGRVSALRTRAICFNGEIQHFPIAVELNGDSADCVPLERLVSISIQ